LEFQLNKDTVNRIKEFFQLCQWCQLSISLSLSMADSSLTVYGLHTTTNIGPAEGKQCMLWTVWNTVKCL